MPSRHRGPLPHFGQWPILAAILLGVLWVAISFGHLFGSDALLADGTGHAHAGAGDEGLLGELARNLTIRIATAERVLASLRQRQREQASTPAGASRLRLARMADALELARAELRRSRSEDPEGFKESEDDQEDEKVVCTKSSKDGVDGWCPPPGSRALGVVASRTAEECMQKARATPECINKLAVSLDRDTGACYCDLVVSCALATAKPPSTDRYECSQSESTLRAQEQLAQIAYDAATGAYRRWRHDFRCGEKGLPRLPDGGAVECGATSDAPCCSNLGWCGGTPSHCACKDCVSYFQVQASKLHLKHDGRECAKVGTDLGSQADLAGCAEKALTERRCGRQVMFAPRMHEQWGCRCCAAGGDQGGPAHAEWQIYEFSL